MKFESNSGGQTNDIPQEAWDAWNEYYWGQIPTEEEPTKNKEGAVVENSFTKKVTKVGLANFFLDCGLQPQPDSEYNSKLEAGTEDGTAGHGVEGIPEGYSDAEKEHVKKFPDNYFRTVKGERKQYRPERPTQEVYIAFDIPDIKIDWSKHPLEKIQKLGVKPLRVSVNGYFAKRDGGNIIWEGFGKSLRFNPNWKTDLLSPNNPIAKLAANMSLTSEFEGSGYDFDKLLGGATNVTFTIVARKEEGKVSRVYPPNFKASGEIVELDIPNVGKFTREQQIPECDIKPVSVMLNQESFDDDILEIIKNKLELKVVLPRATSFQPNAVKKPDFWLGTKWEDTNLCKALGSFGGSESSTSDSKEESTTPKQPVKEEVKASDKTAEEPVVVEDDLSFDDDQ